MRIVVQPGLTQPWRQLYPTLGVPFVTYAPPSITQIASTTITQISGQPDERRGQAKVM